MVNDFEVQGKQTDLDGLVEVKDMAFIANVFSLFVRSVL